MAQIRGRFRLRSGRTADTYFDKYQFESDPSLLGAIAVHLAPLVPEGTQVLAGLELGGVPVVTALSLHTCIPAVFVRKQATEYGTAKLAEGPDIAGRRLLVVEDVVTTGGQLVHSTRSLRALGAEVTAAVCVIDRRQGGGQALADIGVELSALFTTDDL